MGVAAEGALAALPLLVTFVLLVARGWPASRAGPAGLLVAVVLAWFWFGFEEASISYDNRLEPTVGAAAEAGFSAITIIWILVGALSIHQLQEHSGGTAKLRSSITALTSDPRLGVILVAWFFALFLEGAAGFGTPVALTAPLLLTFGVRPIEAVTIALLGHAVGVSFGAVGTPVLAQAAITGYSPLDLAQATIVYPAVLGVLMLIFVMRVTGRALPQTTASQSTPWQWVGFAAACFVVPATAIAVWLGPELPTLGGALIGSGVYVGGLLIWRRSRSPDDASPQPRETVDPMGGTKQTSLAVAGAPYLVLVALVVLTRVVVPIREVLQDVVWQWTLFDSFQGSVQPLYHPGTLLLLSFLIGGAIQRAQPRVLALAAIGAARRIAPVTIALLAMLGLSRLMVHSGMTGALAMAAAEYVGVVWPLVAPSVGILGTFTTGSATASNVLFSDFQQETATQLDLPPLAMLGAQGAGAAVGNVIAPHNIIAGAATVGLQGGEGAVMRRTVPVCVAYAIAAGTMAFLLSRSD